MEQINTCDVLFRGGGKKLDVFFTPRKAVDVHWDTVPPPPKKLKNMV
jgi:hypothetical protein